MGFSLRTYSFPQAKAEYLVDDDTGAVSLTLLPEQKEPAFDHRREKLGDPVLTRIGMDPDAWHVGSLVHLSLTHMTQGNGAGCTLKYGASTRALHLQSQTREGDTVITHLLGEGYSVKHILRWAGTCWSIDTEFCNTSSSSMTLELLTSFSLDNLSPFGTGAECSLRLHRFRGGWSMEGLHQEDTVQSLNLAMPWTYSFPESERFGGVGSHPVKRFFPCCVVEDPGAQVFWGASLAAAGSWQMELSRDSDCFSRSGGLGDREFAGWYKYVQPGETFAAPRAWVAVGESLDQVCRALRDISVPQLDRQPASEQALPVIFNEWCTTWGNPSHARMLRLAHRLAGTHVKYLVIDGGWTNVLPGTFAQGGNGDWEYARDRFPGGLRATSRALRDLGFITGIWFEFEVTTKGAKVYGPAYRHMHLQRDGHVIATGADRSFWDFRRTDVQDFLREKVLAFLRDNEIGYLKVDYNGSIGLGCDGAESLGEGLRQHLDAVLAFFDRLREELPELVIECCASGGHRLTPAFLQRCAMASFSDAHACPEIPVIAGRLCKLLPPRQMQIWAVIDDDQSLDEVSYRLASGFIGRLCLSGSLDTLSQAQFSVIEQAVGLYEAAAPAIKCGRTHVMGEGSRYLRCLTGWQAVTHSCDGLLLVVVHCFNQAPETVVLPLSGCWQLAQSLQAGLAAQVTDAGLIISGRDNTGGVYLLKPAVQ